ncbi:MAG TPA: hypothetical protein VNL71_00565 [Chloroflexota bacterium]|nr:hypothetical protein [Chloroflexota bacterium]
MLKHDPWARVARVEMEERVERATRARQRREAPENHAENGPRGVAILHVSGLLQWMIRSTGRAVPLLDGKESGGCDSLRTFEVE